MVPSGRSLFAGHSDRRENGEEGAGTAAMMEQRLARTASVERFFILQELE